MYGMSASTLLVISGPYDFKQTSGYTNLGGGGRMSLDDNMRYN